MVQSNELASTSRAYYISSNMTVDSQDQPPSGQDHYIGIDVGTSSARACVMNDKGDIIGLASKDIEIWQPETGYYVS